VLDAAHHKIRKPAGDIDPRLESFAYIGRYWLRGENSSSGHPITVYLNWHSGERVTFGEERVAVPRDLNSPNLRTLGAATDSQEVFADGPFIAALRSVEGRTTFGPVILRRSGHPTRTLDRCRNGCASLSIGGGLVTWRSGRRAHVYVLYRGHSVSYKLPAAARDNQRAADTAVMHTRQRILLNIPSGAAAESPFSVYSQPAPR
jgi:hypothetical protein